MIGVINVFLPKTMVEAESNEDYEYTVLEDGTVEVTNYLGCETEIIIPAMIDEKQVTRIGQEAFKDHSELETVSFPEGLTEIQQNAFENCSGLISITIPSSVRSINGNPFNGCLGLESIVVDENNETYDSRDNCNAIICIETNALISGCEATVIPDTVTSIESLAFGGCVNLRNIKVPSNVVSIAEDAFEQCPEEMVIYGDSGSYAEEWAKEQGITFKEDKWEYVALGDGTIKITGYPISAINSEGLICIPETIDEKKVSVLGAMLFENLSDIVTVQISEGIREIEEKCFYNCSALTTVELPESLCVIGDEVFYLCENLKTMEIPQGVTTIGVKAFWYTYWLKNERSKMLGSKLVKEKLGSGYLTTTVTICKPVIINDLFLEASGWIDYTGGTKEEELQVVEDYTIDETVKEVCSYAFYTPFNGVDAEPSANDNIVSIAFENPDTTIAPAAFYGCERLEEVILPANLRIIEELTFAECSSLKRVEIPEGVTSIADNAFLNCTSLEEIKLPSTIETIGSEAFAGVVDESQEKSFTVTIPEDLNVSNLGLENMTNVQYITFNVAEGSQAYIYLSQCENVVIYTYIIQQPENSEDKEETDEKEEEDNVGNLTEDKKETTTQEQVVSENKDEAATGDAVIDQPVVGSTYTVKKLKYKVTSATSVTFVGATNKKMKKVSIPSKVDILGKSFKVTAVGEKALKKYTKLETLVIGSNVKIIGDEAFMKCSKLKKVTIGKNVKTIGKKAFYGDKKLKRIIFKGSKVTKIGKKAMKNVSGVKVTVPTNKVKEKYAKLLRKAK